MPTTIRLQGDYEARIKELARKTGRSQSYYINEMIAREIAQIEWEYGIQQDVAEHRAGRLETVSHDELKAEFGLDD